MVTFRNGQMFNFGNVHRTPDAKKKHLMHKYFILYIYNN